MDRVIGAIFALCTLAGAYVLAFVSWHWPLFWGTLGLGVWTLGGLKKVTDPKNPQEPSGWRGQITIISQRLRGWEVSEGWHWIPFPFSVINRDCRKQTLKLDALEAITGDNVKLNIDATVSYVIVDLFEFLGVEPTGFRTWLDETRDHAIRDSVFGTTLSGALGGRDKIGQEVMTALVATSHQWGIKIVNVAISKVLPDPKVIEDLELERRETAQMLGQERARKNFSRLCHRFRKTGLTPEQAYEQSQLISEAAKKEIKSFTVDSGTVAAAAAFFGGRK